MLLCLTVAGKSALAPLHYNLTNHDSMLISNSTIRTQRFRLKKVKAGLCIRRCNNTNINGTVYCAEHRDANIAACRAWRERTKVTRRILRELGKD